MLTTFKPIVIIHLGDSLWEFVSADDSEKKVVFSRIEEEVNKLKGSAARYGSLYLKLPKNSMENAADYAKNEIHRLQRVLEKNRRAIVLWANIMELHQDITEEPIPKLRILRVKLIKELIIMEANLLLQL